MKDLAETVIIYALVIGALIVGYSLAGNRLSILIAQAFEQLPK